MAAIQYGGYSVYDGETRTRAVAEQTGTIFQHLAHAFSGSRVTFVEG